MSTEVKDFHGLDIQDAGSVITSYSFAVIKLKHHLGLYLGTAAPAEAAAATTTVYEYALLENHPLTPLFGKYQNDPLWAELEKVMDRNRALDSVDDTVE